MHDATYLCHKSEILSVVDHRVCCVALDGLTARDCVWWRRCWRATAPRCRVDDGDVVKEHTTTSAAERHDLERRLWCRSSELDGRVVPVPE